MEGSAGDGKVVGKECLPKNIGGQGWGVIGELRWPIARYIDGGATAIACGQGLS